MNTTIRVISRISFLLPLSVCAAHLAAIGFIPRAIDYFSDNSATHLETSETTTEQKDTFVPQPNHLPLFTRGSGTR